MKHLLLLTLIGISSFNLFAQPTLTSSLNAASGDVYTTYTSTTSGISIGPSGAAKTWDFSGFLGSSLVINDFNTTDVSPLASDYPNATLVYIGTGGENFISETSSTKEYWGYGEGQQTMIYSNPETLLNYPFTYNNTFTDNFTGMGEAGAPYYRRGVATCKADAYGTLKTPEGTFSNVLRVSFREVIVDSVSGGGQRTFYNRQTYSWYKDGFGNPLFFIRYDTTNSNGNKTVDSTAGYAEDVPSAVKNINGDFNLNIYPNPATNKITIHASEGVSHVVINNMLGQIVKDVYTDNISPDTPVDISIASLPDGIYSCTVSTSSGSATRKILKD